MKKAVLNDWQKVCGDIRVAFGLSVRRLDIDNVLGNKTLLSVFKDRRVNKR